LNATYTQQMVTLTGNGIVRTSIEDQYATNLGTHDSTAEGNTAKAMICPEF